MHIQPIVKRYCISCHRPGKDSYNYFMDTYENILKSGDDSDSNVIAGDENSFLLQVIQGTPIPDTVNPGKDLIGVMPPKGHLKPDAIEAFRRWILMGMPETAEDAAGLTWPTPAATPKP